MDIFTDASVNDHEKIAGVSAVFVPSMTQDAIVRFSTHLSVDNNETAELFAIAIALSHVNCQPTGSIRIVSDSYGAMKKIQRIFQYPNQTQIQTIDNILQKRILFNMAASFAQMQNVTVNFCEIHAHQRKAQPGTDGYYNQIADQEAAIGREKAETMRLKENKYKTGSGSLTTPEEEAILTQPECEIVSPKKITFTYEGGGKKKKKVASHTQKKDEYVRHSKRMGGRQR